MRDLEDKVIEEHHQDSLEAANDDGELQILPIAVCEEAFAEWFADVLGDLEKIDPSPTIDVRPAPKTEIVGLMRSGCGATIKMRGRGWGKTKGGL